MLFDGIRLGSGTDISNAVIDSGTTFPSAADPGELFFRTDLSALHVYTGSQWEQVGQSSATLEGQTGSYYLDLANHTGTLGVGFGGTGAVTAAAARANLGLVIGTDAQAFDLDLSAIAALSGTTGLLRKTAANTWALDTTTYLSTAGGTLTGNLTMTGHVLPAADITYDLGSPSLMWRDLYVGPGSIYMNGKKILEDVSDTIVFSTDLNQNLRIETTGTGNLELMAAATGSVLVKAAMTITSGKKILDSAGMQVEFGDNIDMGGNKITSVATPTNPGDAAPKSYVDGAFVSLQGSQTITGDKVFTGNVSLNGSMLVAADNIIELNSDVQAGTPTEDAGFQIRRGDLNTVRLLWDEANDRFTLRDSGGTGLPLYTTGTVTATGGFVGNADSATRLINARNISLAGDATGSTTFDGTANASITATLTSVNGNVGTFGSGTQIPSLTVDAKGRVTAVSNTAINVASFSIAESQIADGSLLARLGANETITGNWTFSNPVAAATPTSGNHLATKEYVDNTASGMNVHLAVRAATTTALTATYANGSGGVGATLTGTGILPAIDGVTLVADNRVLIKNQANPVHNGIYTVTAVSPNWVLTRATDFDGAPTNEVVAGDSTFVQEGGQATTQWVQTTTGAITVGSSAIVFTQFGGPGAYNGGAGLTLNGTTFNIGTASAARIVVNADDIDLATAGTAGTYRSVTTDVYGRVTAGTNPTTLAGYGITDAVLKTGDTMTGSLVLRASNEAGGAILSTQNANAGNVTQFFVSHALGTVNLGNSRTDTGGLSLWTNGEARVVVDAAGDATFSGKIIGTTLERLTAGALTINSSNAAGSIDVRVAGASRVTVDNTGNMTFQTTNSGLNWASLSGFTVKDNIGSGNPGINFDSNDFIDYNRASNIMRFAIGGTVRLSLIDTSLTASGIVYAPQLSTPTGQGRIDLLGGGANSGYIEFWSSAGVRQGYIGNSTTNSASDAGNLPYVAGTHSFSGAMNVSGTITGTLSGNATTATTANNTLNMFGVGNAIYSTSSGTSYSLRPQVRELNAAGAQGQAAAARPMLAFHWGGVVASQIGIEPSGRIAIFDNPGTGYENFIAKDITATSFTGSGSGLTGTAASLTAGAATTAATATNSTQLGGISGNEYLVYRGSIDPANSAVDRLPGIYNVQNPGDSELLMDIHSTGSTPRLQILARYDDQLYFRVARDSKTQFDGVGLKDKLLLHTSNYNSYSPTLTGGGASGTWGINITGSSGSVNGLVSSVSPTANTVLARDGNGYSYHNYINSNTGNNENGTLSQVIITNGADNFYRKASVGHLTANLSGTAPISITGNAATATASTSTSVWNMSGSIPDYVTYMGGTTPGTRRWNEASTGGPVGTWWFLDSMRHTNAASTWGRQNAWGWEDNANEFYSRNVSNGVYGSWVRFLNSQNFNSYAPTLGGTGASGTWSINVTGNAATVNNSAGRTDSASYPVLWGTTGASTQAYSCSAVTIQSSSGTLSASIVEASGTGGFKSATFATNSRNPIWRFGNADSYGLSYFQGTSGLAGQDVIGFHFGTATAAGSPVYIRADGYLQAGTFGGSGSGLTGTAGSLTAGNVTSVSSATSGSYQWTGVQNFLGSNNTAFGGQAGALTAYGNSGGTNAATMSFHRPGQYAVNMGLDTDNVFRIGGWSASANRLQMDMSGNLTMAGDITAFSDSRKKRDIVTIDRALERVEAMRGVNFTRIEDGVRGSGVIAQEVQEVLPEVVKADADGMLSVAYGNIVGVLIEAVKELSAQNKALLSRLEALESKE